MDGVTQRTDRAVWALRLTVRVVLPLSPCLPASGCCLQFRSSGVLFFRCAPTAVLISWRRCVIDADQLHHWLPPLHLPSPLPPPRSATNALFLTQTLAYVSKHAIEMPQLVADRRQVAAQQSYATPHPLLLHCARPLRRASRGLRRYEFVRICATVYGPGRRRLGEARPTAHLLGSHSE